MKLKFTYLLLAFGFLYCQQGVFAQRKHKKKHQKEQKISRQGKDDSKHLLNQKGSQLSYKALFYEAVRLKTVGAYDSSIALFKRCVKLNPKSDASYYALTEFYSAKRQYNHALENIEKAYAIDLENIWYLEKMANLQLTVGQYENAEKSYLRLIQRKTHNIDWIYGYSQAQLFNGKIKDAIVTYNKMIEEVGPVPKLVARKMELMIDQKQDEKMVEELKILIKEHPNSPEFANLLIDYYIHEGKKDEAKNLLEQLIKKAPKNGAYQLRMAQFYDKSGDNNKMYYYLKQAFKNTAVDIDTKVKLLISAYDEQDQIDSNLFDLVQILEDMYPESAKTHTISGDLLLKSKQPKKALLAFKKALKYDQSKFSIWNEVLILQYKSKQYDSLFVYGEKALELYPSFGNLYLLTGIGAMQSNHLEAAANYFTQGANYVLADKKMSAEFAFQLGEVQIKQNKIDEAWRNFDRALELDSNNALYLNNYAYRLAVQNTQLQVALELTKKANSIAPNNANFLDTYAWVLFKMKKYKEAREKMAKALQLSPKENVFMEHYGDILYFLNEQEAALKYWKSAQLAGNKSETLTQKITTKKYHEKTTE